MPNSNQWHAEPTSLDRESYDVSAAIATAAMAQQNLRHPMAPWYPVAKRLLDLTVAVTLLVITAPLMLVAMLLVRFRLGRPVLFRQERSGLKGRPFLLVKFRTMRDTRDAAGQVLPDAERLTPLGRWLRATSIDELPQLWNVLRGEMSLVGPRPLLTRYLQRYTPHQRRRLEVMPGITGWAQVQGRNAISWEQKFACDVWYVDHRGMLLDLVILGKTVSCALFGRGVASNDHVTMPEFFGTASGDGSGETRTDGATFE